MFEDLVTLSSSEDEEDIEIVEERLNANQISSPRKINKIIEVLRKNGHVPLAAATKVRNVQFFSAQGPLRLDEVVGGEDGISWKKYKIKTVATVSHKRRKVESGGQPRPQPGGRLRQRFPNSRLPVLVKPRRKIIEQLRDQVEVMEVGRKYNPTEGLALRNSTTAVRSEDSPPHMEDRAGGTGASSDDGISSQEDFCPSPSYRDFSNLLAFESSEEEDVGVEDFSSNSSSSVTPGISTAEGSTQVRVYTDLLAIGFSEEEEELGLEKRPLGNHLETSPERKINHSRKLASPVCPASPQLELVTFSSEDEEEERISPEDLITFSNSEEVGRIFPKDFLSSDISEAAEKKRSEEERRPSEELQSSPGATQEAADLLGISRPSPEEEVRGEIMATPVSQISEGPSQHQSSPEVERPEEVPGGPPVSEPGCQGAREEAGISQREFLRYFGLVSHQEAEEER